MQDQNTPAVAEVIAKADEVVQQAERNADGSDTYCVPTDAMDALSSALVRVGGAS